MISNRNGVHDVVAGHIGEPVSTVGRITQLLTGKPNGGWPLGGLPVVLTDIQVVKRESGDRIKELIEANNRELKRRRAMVTTMQAIMVRSNCEVTKGMARKALEKDVVLARGVEGN